MPDKVIVVDYRNLAKICSYSILSGSVACQFPTEPEEIAHRIAKRLYCIKSDYPDATIILADDKGPYWRHRFIDKWYSDRGLEPVGYKANRTGMTWPFVTPKENMDMLYEQIYNTVSNAIRAYRIKDAGLEADDIWGIIVATSEGAAVTGISTDSDWRQLCGEAVSVIDPATGIEHKTKEDIRPKCIAGDRGDNIMGCNKKTKKGEAGKTMWGKDGAAKLILTNPEWKEQIDSDTYERNFALVSLPCPLWDIEEASTSLLSVTVAPEEVDEDAVWDAYGITANVRKLLNDKSARDLWIEKLRGHLAKINEEVGKVAHTVSPNLGTENLRQEDRFKEDVRQPEEDGGSDV